MIQNLIFGILFLENIISVLGIQLFIFVTYFSQNHQIFFFFFYDFLAESLKANKN